MKKNSHRSNPVKSNFAVERPKLFFVGEGPQDIGRPAKVGGALVGFLHAALCGPGVPEDVEQVPFEVSGVCLWRNIKLTRKQRSFDDLFRLKPDAERVRAAMVIAATRGDDGVVVLRDCEQPDRFDLQVTLRQARQDYANHESGTKRPILVVATPSRCHETWLLADIETVRQISGQSISRIFSGDPEARPHCDDLKSRIATLATASQMKLPEFRERLAFAARPKVLSKHCPKCYQPFLDDVESELRPLCRVE